SPQLTRLTCRGSSAGTRLSIRSPISDLPRSCRVGWVACSTSEQCPPMAVSRARLKCRSESTLQPESTEVSVSRYFPEVIHESCWSSSDCNVRVRHVRVRFAESGGAATGQPSGWDAEGSRRKQTGRQAGTRVGLPGRAVALAWLGKWLLAYEVWRHRSGLRICRHGRSSRRRARDDAVRRTFPKGLFAPGFRRRHGRDQVVLHIFGWAGYVCPHQRCRYS